MVEHVYRRTASTSGVDAVVVATDDARIAAAVERFGGIARMTRSRHRTGTDRIAEVVSDVECDIVVNVQGDLPMIEPSMIAQVLQPFARDPDAHMSTLRQPITDPADCTNPNVVKVVVNRQGDALYFSRAPIPFVRGIGPCNGGLSPTGAGAPEASPTGPDVGLPFYKHIGLYAYRRAFLLSLTALPQTPLEVVESLEQLRAIEHGFRITTVETAYESIEVDTPDDIERVRRQLTAWTHA